MGLLTNEPGTEYDAEYAQIQAARKAQLEDYNTARTAAGETPQTSQDSSDSLQAIDAQTGANYTVQLQDIGGGEGGSILVASMVIENYTGPLGVSQLHNGNVGHDWDFSDPRAGMDGFNVGPGITVDENGIIEIFFRVVGISNDGDTSGQNEIQCRIMSVYNAPSYFSPIVDTDGSGSQSSRVFVNVDKWPLYTEDATHTKNVQWAWGITVPSAAETGHIQFDLLEAMVIWTPAPTPNA